VLWEDGRNLPRFLRAADGETRRAFASIEYFADGKGREFLDRNVAASATWFRVGRQGEDYRFWFSLDGKDWTEMIPRATVRLGKKLEVGVAAVNSTVNPFVPRFNQFQLRQGVDATSPPLAVAPFDAAKAKEYQEAWAKHLGVPVECTNSIGMKLRLIPPGEFTMGAAPEDLAAIIALARTAKALDSEISMLKNEGVPSPVRLTKPYYLGVCEVTRGQFRKFVDATGYKTTVERTGQGGWSHHNRHWVQRPEHTWATPGDWEPRDDEPVVHLTWDDVRAFCQWLSRADGRTYTLPTEAQWEFACRAGATTQYSFGDDRQLVGQYAWYVENSDSKPHAVATKLPNPFGLFDMCGDPYEWCQDFWTEGWYGRSSADDPKGPEFGVSRVIRGGC
jgi:formylglycine-generating enzyme required for sulfatase activity